MARKDSSKYNKVRVVGFCSAINMSNGSTSEAASTYLRVLMLNKGLRRIYGEGRDVRGVMVDLGVE